MDVRSIGKQGLGIILLVLGVGIFVFISFQLFDDLQIWFFGYQTTGTVVNKGYEQINDDSYNKEFEYYLEYEFHAADGRPLSGSSSVSVAEWSMYPMSGDISILYSRLDPTINKIDDSQYLALFVCAYIPFIILGLLSLSSGWEMAGIRLRRKGGEEQRRYYFD